MRKNEVSSAKKVKTSLTLDRREAMERDYIILNNPVFVSGYAMATAVGGASDMKSALLLALAGMMLIIPVRIIGDFFFDVVTARLRVIFYTVISGITAIPMMILFTQVFGVDALLLGLYLPLLFIDNVVIFRSVAAEKEGVRLVWGGAFFTAVGYAAAILLVGFVREFLARGSAFGYKLVSFAVWPGAQTVAGGLLTVAVICAGWNVLCALVKKYVYLGGNDDE